MSEGQPMTCATLLAAVQPLPQPNVFCVLLKVLSTGLLIPQKVSIGTVYAPFSLAEPCW